MQFLSQKFRQNIQLAKLYSACVIFTAQKGENSFLVANASLDSKSAVNFLKSCVAETILVSRVFFENLVTDTVELLRLQLILIYYAENVLHVVLGLQRNHDLVSVLRSVH